MLNLSSVPLTEEQVYVFKLGLTFCPSTDIDRFQLIKNLHFIARRLMFKVIYDKPSTMENYDFPPLEFSQLELQAMDNLMLLWEEGHTSDKEPPVLTLPGVAVPGMSFPPPTSFIPKSHAFPLLHANPNIWAFVQQSTSKIKSMDLDDQHLHNLSFRHRRALRDLQCHLGLVVIKPADKGGNVVVMGVGAY